MQWLASPWLLAAPFNMNPWLYYGGLGVIVIGLGALLYFMNKKKNQED